MGRRVPCPTGSMPPVVCLVRSSAHSRGVRASLPRSGIGPRTRTHTHRRCGRRIGQFSAVRARAGMIKKVRSHLGHVDRLGSVDITEDLARRLVAGQFPQWSHLPIRPVAIQGNDNRTFRLGDHLALRLPQPRELRRRNLQGRQVPAPAGRVPVGARSRTGGYGSSDRGVSVPVVGSALAARRRAGHRPPTWTALASRATLVRSCTSCVPCPCTTAQRPAATVSTGVATRASTEIRSRRR